MFRGGTSLKYHPLDRTTVYFRERLAKAVLEGQLSLNGAAAELDLSRQSAGNGVERMRREGWTGCASPRPPDSARPSSAADDPARAEKKGT